MKTRYLKIAIIAIGLITSYCTDKTSTSDTTFEIFTQPIQGLVTKENGDEYIKSPNSLHIPGRYVWGGSVVKGKDDKYHMFFSTWPIDTAVSFSQTWVLRSEIGYAVSDYPDRNFTFKKIILRGRKYSGDSSAWDAEMVHNPHIKKFNGTYYLYYGGSKDPGERPEGDPGYGLSKRNRIQQVQKIGVVKFETINDVLKGNFTRLEEPLISPRTRVKSEPVIDPSDDVEVSVPDNLIVVNPSVVFRPSDKKYLLYFKGNVYNPHWRGVHGVAVSDSPEGPFETKDNFVFDVLDEDGKLASAEDPYVWYQPEHQKFYVIFKDFTGKITGSTPGLAIMESKDGIDWSVAKSGTSIQKKIILESGDTIRVSHLERPQLLIDESGIPLVLYSACSLKGMGQLTTESTFNIHLPLNIRLR